LKFSRLPVLFISHGGGPWPYVAGLREKYARTEQVLTHLPQRLAARPKCVLVVSGHWEAPEFSVATAAYPSMEYDYSGFPPHTYQIKYEAPGESRLATQILGLLQGRGIVALPDANRGFDHGVFVPMALMFPAADMPILMVSVKSGYAPAEHLALGEALAPLRDEGVLIVGSGLNYHNMRGFGRVESARDARVFTDYLNEAVSQTNSAERSGMLMQWERAPQARAAHPREDHLMPLLVASGAALNDRGRVLLSDEVLHIPMTSYVFGELANDFVPAVAGDPRVDATRGIQA
jgi:aromatic ring-opening dioxygenase catalytic subunit (LigB family)